MTPVADTTRRHDSLTCGKPGNPMFKLFQVTSVSQKSVVALIEGSGELYEDHLRQHEKQNHQHDTIQIYDTQAVAAHGCDHKCLLCSKPVYMYRHVVC
jgi:hypothetical protein